MNFTAIDVETANSDMASICQIGIARFANGVMADEWKSYVKQDDFDPINVSIHGIDEGMVAGAPTFGMLANKINGLLNGHVVVTHTHFDRVAIHQACTRFEATPPSCTWLDTACVARRNGKSFHGAVTGCRMSARRLATSFRPMMLWRMRKQPEIMLAAMTKTGLDLDAWLKRVRQPIDPELARIARDGRPDGELYGEVLVFTGALTIPRREAADMAASIGCEVGVGVTKRTTLLVVGDQDVLKLAGHEKSTKHRKAEDLIRKGQPIRILRETDFRELVKLAGFGFGELARETCHWRGKTQAVPGRQSGSWISTDVRPYRCKDPVTLLTGMRHRSRINKTVRRFVTLQGVAQDEEPGCAGSNAGARRRLLKGLTRAERFSACGPEYPQAARRS